MTGLVGRDEELLALESAIRATKSPIRLSGEPGVGKTALAMEAVSRFGGGEFLHVSAETIGGAGPYELILGLLEGMITAGRDKIQDIDAVLESLMKAPPPPRRVAAALRGLMSAMPLTAVIFDDLDWADELSLAVLGHLARTGVQDGRVYLWLFRGGGTQALARLLDLFRDEGVQINLATLDPGATEELARRANPELGQLELRQVVERSDGIPFFALELVREVEHLDQPSRLAALAQAELSSLGPQAQSILRPAALAGTFDVDLLASVSGLSPQAVVEAFRDAVNLGLMTERESRTAFRHTILREAIAALMPAAERQWIHRLIAEALEMRRGQSGISAPAGLVAYHFNEAGLLDKARHYYLVAGSEALRVGALAEAEAAFARVVSSAPSVADQCRAEVGLAEVMSRQGRLEEAVDLLWKVASLLEGADTVEGVGDTLIRLAAVQALPDPRSSVRILDRVLEYAAGQPNEELRSRGLVAKGYVLVRMLNEPHAGRQHLEEGLAFAGARGLVDVASMAHEGLAWCHEEEGNQSQADHHARKACDLALFTQDYAVIARAFGGRASALALHGQLLEALELLDAATHHIGNEAVHLLRSIDHARAWIHWLGGHPSAAEHLSALLEPTRFARIYGRVVRIWAAIESNRAALAEQMLVSWWQELGGEEFRRSALLDLRGLEGEVAQAALAEVLAIVWGPRSGADGLDIVRSFHEACRGGRPDSVGLGATLYARALIDAGRYEEARDALALCDDPAMHQHPHRLASALELRALSDLSLGRGPTDGIRLLEDAAQLLRGMGSGVDLARTLRLAGTWTSKAGDKMRARELLREALETASRFGAVREQLKAERGLRDLGFRPRAGRPKGSGLAPGQVSDREKEVIVLLASGAGNSEIARRLFISERTVENHLARAQRRLGVRSRAELAAWAAKQGWI